MDTVRAYPGAGLRFERFCHLLADTHDELHAMADALGIPRRFFQDHPWRWHHDPCPSICASVPSSWVHTR